MAASKGSAEPARYDRIVFFLGIDRAARRRRRNKRSENAEQSDRSDRFS